MRLLVTGGGTGGHVYPLVAVLTSLAANHALELTSDVLYIGRGGSVEERIAHNLKLRFAPIRVGGLRSLGPLTQIRNTSQLVMAARQAGQVIAEFRPDVVLATGGYVSAPAVWAAWRQHVPIIIELPDLEPGWAIRALWRFSRQVAVSFEEVLRNFPRGRATVTGYPVRAQFYQATRDAGRARFKLDPSVPVLTVFGGSQGAHALNEAVRLNLRELLQQTQLLHVTGTFDRATMEVERARLDVGLAARLHVFEYLHEDMPFALAAADLVMARAGAATLGEFPAVGVPSLLVPGLFAAGHQEKNADFMVERGASVKLDEERLKIELVKVVTSLLRDGTRLAEMAEAARKMAQPDAAQKIGELLLAAV